MHHLIRSVLMLGGFSLLAMGWMTTPAMSEGKSPTDGYDIHIQAPHMMADGTVGGPYHHYCKGISDELLQCQLYESTDPNAKLVAIEYFIAKDLARKNVPLIQWNRAFHDHQVEIDTGRVQILDVEDPAKVKALAEAAGKTDGVIFHLWGKHQVVPDGAVSIPTSLGHVFRTE
ncbi:MAG TPA: DUF1264 domain-containing protein [Nitrospirales bacterium]|nr:DUF1264 domain-containing protein [Nitrospira sp. MA-1]HNP59680.1 DUF1264 domain-containing protein [Nitrospirales bacterium]